MATLEYSSSAALNKTGKVKVRYCMINLPENNVTMIEVLTNDDDRVTAELHRPPEHEHSQALNHSPTSFFSIAFHLPQ